MEGTRHERAALVVVAYFIGAVTVFIGFNAPQVDYSESTTDLTASVINANQSVQATQASSIARYAERVLTVMTLDGERTLSFSVEASDQIPSEFSVQGAHFGELSYSASPSDEFIFFCEQKSPDADTCSPFVYDVLSDTIYPLRLNGERVALLTTAAGTASWSGNILTIGSETSRDAVSPWLLGGL